MNPIFEQRLVRKHPRRNKREPRIAVAVEYGEVVIRAKSKAHTDEFRYDRKGAERLGRKIVRLASGKQKDV